MRYNSTYAYVSLSSHSKPPQQLLNVATKSVLTPNRTNQTPLKLTKLQLKTAAGLNNVNGVHRQNYGELKTTRSDTSINVFSNYNLPAFCILIFMQTTNTQKLNTSIVQLGCYHAVCTRATCPHCPTQV